MLIIPTKRHIRFMTVERPAAWIIVAFLVETRGDETKVVSGPRIVKIIQKKGRELQGGCETNPVFRLATSLSHTKTIATPVESPYISTIFGYTNTDFIVGLAARPPTVA